MSTDTGYDPFAMDDVDADAVGSGGFSPLPEGGYKVRITEVIVQNDRGSTEMKCEVLDAIDQTMLARSHTEYLSWPSREYSEVRNRIVKEHLLAWCYAAKTTSPDEIKARQQRREGFDAGWLEAAVGHDVLLYIKQSKYEDQNGNEKTSAKAEGRVWALDNPKGSGIPGWVGKPSNGNGQQSNQGDSSSSFDDLV